MAFEYSKKSEKPRTTYSQEKIKELKREFNEIAANPIVKCNSFYSAYSPLCPSPNSGELAELMEKKIERFIYLDNNATHPLLDSVRDKMTEMAKFIGNPSSKHLAGERVRAYVEAARSNMANHIGTDDSSRLFFTASGSESNNTFIKGVAFKNIDNDKKEIITTPYEHKAVLRVVEYLSKFGFIPRYAQVDSNGLVDVDHLKSIVNENTLLVSIMSSNNEVGTVLPVHEYYNIVKENSDALFHTDMSQTIGKVPNVKVGELDAATITGHKFGGPIGISILYVKDRDSFDPLIHGGNQEFNKRAGTYNSIFISALNIAFEELRFIKYKETAKLRDYLDTKLLELFDCNINCQLATRMVNTTSVTFKGVIGDELISFLSDEGIFISSSSACTSHEKNPSHVLKAIGLTDEEAYSTVRISLNRYTTKEEIDLFINKVRDFYER